MHSQLHTAGNTRGDIDFYHFLIAHHALAVAFRALVLDDSSLAVAGRALLLHLHHAEDTALRAHHPSRAFAGRTSLAAAAVCATRALTRGAGNQLAYFDFLRRTRSYLLQRQTHLHAQVRTSAHTLPTATPTAAEQIAQVETCAAEDIAELREDILHRHALPGSETAHAVHARVPELVVALPFLRVGKHLVCLRCLLEFLLGFLVAGVLIGVILNGFLAVGFLYLVRRRRLRHTQHLIIISFLCHIILLFENEEHRNPTILYRKVNCKIVNCQIVKYRYSPTTTLAKRITFSPNL